MPPTFTFIVLLYTFFTRARVFILLSLRPVFRQINFKARLRDHRFYVDHGKANISPLAAHRRVCGCKFDFDGTAVLDSDSSYFKLQKKKEAAHIAIASNAVNFDDGANLARSWALILPDLAERH